MFRGVGSEHTGVESFFQHAAGLFCLEGILKCIGESHGSAFRGLGFRGFGFRV